MGNIGWNVTFIPLTIEPSWQHEIFVEFSFDFHFKLGIIIFCFDKEMISDRIMETHL